jgi:hypothetical protein
MNSVTCSYGRPFTDTTRQDDYIVQRKRTKRRKEGHGIGEPKKRRRKREKTEKAPDKRETKRRNGNTQKN